MNNRRFQVISVFAAGLITAVIFLSVLAVKGIWPFGASTIDYYDMGQTNAPLYYHLWDFLHFKGPLFYTPFLDGGQNLSMASAIQWNISVYNLFYYLIPRSLCFRSLSLFTGLRLVFMSVNMCIFLVSQPGRFRADRFSETDGSERNIRDVKTSAAVCIAMSVCYGLCGYTLTHYTITTYLDTAALFPLLMLTLFRVLQNSDDICIGKKIKIKRTAVYSLCLGYMTALSYYLGFMDLIFILLVSGTCIFLIVPKEERGTVSAKLVTGTVLGLLISAFILLPAALQMTTSSRFNSNMEGSVFGTLKDILWAIGADMYYIKGFAVFGCFFAAAFIITGLFRFRKEKRINLFLCLFCFYPCALIIFESINLLWHMGTYYHYPIRCGYLIPFVLLAAGAYFAEKQADRIQAGSQYFPVTGYIIFAALAVILAVAVLRIYTGHGVWEIHDLFKVYLIFAAVMFCIYFVFIIFKRPDGALFFLAAELFVGAFIGYGMPNFTDVFSSDPEQSGAYVETALDLKDDLGIEESTLDRIKNPDTMLNTNYGMVIRRATVGGWANTARRDHLDATMAFGYNAHFMRILDSGGTVFSDALLHVTQTLTCRDELYTKKAYEKIKQSGDYSLFDNKYILPSVMFTKEDFAGAFKPGTDAAKITNAYYAALYEGCTGSGPRNEEIAEYHDEMKLHVDGIKALYLHGGSGEEIRVNGRSIPVPTIGHPDNKEYPAPFNSNLLYLGIYENEDVKIEGVKEEAKILSVDLLMLEELCSICSGKIPVEFSNGSYSFTVTADSAKQALVPLTFDRGFKAYVNGKKTRVRNVDEMFMGIPLEEGTNEVRLEFKPFGFTAGIIVSTAGLILALFVLPFFDEKRFGNACRILTGAVFAAALTVFYIIPIGAFIVHQILKRI
ncbi:MAG: YfhO family protein [Lachnospiraceae bacterium]|nr:YfhO family protein [Lachnospiraceae bacterium]